MKLPQIEQPIYEVKLLSYDKPIKFRPFTVREEMILRMAAEAKDLDSTVNALKQVVMNCLVDVNIDIDNMAIVDMETIFLNLRARSIGETGSQFFKCKNEVDNSNGGLKPCNHLIEVPIKYLEIPVINKDVERNIKFTDELGVRMKFPSYNLAKVLTTVRPEEAEVTIVANCLDKIYSKNEIFNALDCTHSELLEFVLKLPPDKYEKMKDFCYAAPKNQLVAHKKCTKCGFEHTFTLEGIQDFFG